MSDVTGGLNKDWVRRERRGEVLKSYSRLTTLYLTLERRGVMSTSQMGRMVIVA